MPNHQRLLERFLRYVQVDTTAGDGERGYPSSQGQLELGRMLVEELREIGLADAEQDSFGIVMATLPPTCQHQVPVIAFNAHVDTSPETTGKDVKPHIWRDYAGRDLVLPGDKDKVIRVEENAELKSLVGRTIITSDGTTLLGADDKAGLAVIMEAIHWLAEHPEVEHGAVRVLFTCDEEIGHGVDHVDLHKLGATACYTLDGAGADQIDVETFSADLATVVVRGVNIHPSIGKGRMINALRVAADFIARLPRDLSPETTDDRQGFLHPYLVDGGVAQVTLKILLRDFQTNKLAEQARVLHQAKAATHAAWPGSRVDVTVTPQYRNMAEGLAREPRAVAYAEEAHRRLARQPQRTIIRGGTDGSRLTELGLPTPNLSTGEHNPHSPLEWTCLEEMAAAVEVVAMLAQVWADGNLSG
ncbi:MAG TPA: peptidase T [Pirellulales bacterium]|nr:peptidase T [Pirellulales bacterium]